MAKIYRSKASLRIFGDMLIPDEITGVLGKSPTQSRCKGELLKSGKQSGTGAWLLSTKEHKPGNLDAQIDELLSELTDDLVVWRNLTSKFKVDIFCGIFMHESNEGIALSSRTLMSLGERGLVLSLDIYSGPDE